MRSERRNRLSLALTSNCRLLLLRRQRFLRRLDGPRERTRLGAVHETDDGLQRDFHLEARGARALTDGLHTSILSNRGSNGVG